MSESEGSNDVRSRRRERAVRGGKYLGGVIGALVVLVVVLFLLGVVGIPDAGLEDNRWGEVSDGNVEVITEVWIDNPNPFGAEADVAYDVELQEIRLAEGEGTGLEIGSGNATQNLTSDLFTESLPPWWASHLENDERSALDVDATIDASVGPLSRTHETTVEDEIDTDIEGALDESSSELEGSYPEAIPLLEIEDVTTEWGEVTEDETEIRTTFTFHNPNEGTVIVLPDSGFSGHTEFNDIRMAEWETDEVTVVDEDGEVVDEDVIVEGGERTERTFVVELDNTNIPEWFESHVERGEFTEIRWASELTVQVFEEDDELSLPAEVDDLLGELPIDDLPAELTIPPGDETIDCDIDLQTGIFVDQDTDVSFQGCQMSTVELDDVTAISSEDGPPSGDDGDGSDDGDDGDGSDDGDDDPLPGDDDDGDDLI